MRTRRNGFTLIELVIAVAVVGILASIALPSYKAYQLRAQRATGKGFLQDVASREENYLADRKAYSTTLTDLGYSADAATTAGKVFLTRDGRALNATASDVIYTVTFKASSPTPSATDWIMEATPVGIQASDTQCGTLSIRATGVKAASGTLGLSCWSK